jgi:hypothetical protein
MGILKAKDFIFGSLAKIVFFSTIQQKRKKTINYWLLVIQSIYVPGKPENNERRPIVDFKPISVDVRQDNFHRQLNARHSLSPSRRTNPISPNLNRKIFEPDLSHDARPTERPRLFGQFSPPPRRKLQPNRHMFYSPTRQVYSPPPLFDLRMANQQELAERQSLDSNPALNGHRTSTSPTRQFSVVPPNRSLSPIRSSYRDLSPRNWSTNMPAEVPVRNTK